MELSEVTTIRLPAGSIQKLRQMAHRTSIQRQTDVSWAAIVRELIAELLAPNEQEPATR